MKSFQAFFVTGVFVCSFALITSFGCSPAISTPIATASAGGKIATPETTENLRQRIDGVIDWTLNHRLMNSKDNAAWQVVHGIEAYGRDLPMEHNGQKVLALDWLLKGGNLKGWVLRPSDHGVETIVEAGSKSGQGHPDQWLGYLSQCGVRADEPIVVSDNTYTISDLLSQSQWNIYDGMEATWTLMALVTYWPIDQSWTAKDGSTWDMERVVAMETKAAPGGACGGTHRMYALAIAVNRYLAEKHLSSRDQLTGGWLLAAQKIDDGVHKVHEFQQPDGSFSVNFFDRSGTVPDVTARLHATGHTLEFLDVALSDAQMHEPWVTKGAWRLVKMLEQTKNAPLDCGALYHGVHALMLYKQSALTPPNSKDATSATAAK